MVAAAARAAVAAQILRMKSKMAAPLFHPACGSGVAVVYATVLGLVDFNSAAMLMVVSPLLLLESIAIKLIDDEEISILKEMHVVLNKWGIY